jgi:dTMP kinase
VAAERLSSARVPDKFESQPVAFFENVRSGYAKRMADSPSRFVQIDAEQTREAVWLDVLKSVQAVCAS